MLVVVWGALARAQEPPAEGEAAAAPKTTSASFNEDFEIRYWRVTERLPNFPDKPVLDYIEQVNRLNANLVSGRWSFALQLDEVALLANRYVLDNQLVVERPLTVAGLPSVFPPGSDVYATLEKIRGGYDAKLVSVQLGDSYVAFGRGIALNLNRNVDIDIDSSVQGAKVVLHPGAWDLSLVAGQANRQQVQQDNPNHDIFGDFRHTIAGLRVERFGLGPANIGAHGVLYEFVEDTGWAAGIDGIGTAPDVVVGGLTGEFIGVGGIDWFAEGDVIGFGPNQPVPLGWPNAPDTGYALYGSASAYPGPFVVLVEGKRYYQAERINADLSGELYEVAVAPTLEYERAVTEDSSTAVNSNDISGGRVQVDWSAVPGKLSPNASVAVFRDDDLSGGHFNPEPETILHPILGVEWIDGEVALIANAGHRWDIRDGNSGADRELHGDLLLNFPLPRELAGYLSLFGESVRPGEDLFPRTDFYTVETGLTLTWNGTVSLTGFVDKTTDPLATQQFAGNLSDDTFGAVEAQLKPDDAWTIKAFYGAQKAGIRCAGGQCRKLPGFNGARISVVGTF